jgi:hypothetical protein
MKSPITLAKIDRLQAAVDSAARLHRLGLALFVFACSAAALPYDHARAWLPLAGLAATVLAFAIKSAGTLREIRLAGILGRVMAMPYRRALSARGSDTSAWASIRSYVVVSVVLTVAAALAPSMLAAVGETAFARLTIMASMAALMIQSFDNPKRLHRRIMLICSSRMDLHASDDEVLTA